MIGCRSKRKAGQVVVQTELQEAGLSTDPVDTLMGADRQWDRVQSQSFHRVGISHRHVCMDLSQDGSMHGSMQGSHGSLFMLIIDL